MRYLVAHAYNDVTGDSVRLYVPAASRHRPAVSRFLSGKYFESFSHYAYKQILEYRGGGTVIHAGMFFGDMLDTLSKSAEMVFAFEPVLDNYYFAKKNAAYLGLSNVVLVNAALGAESNLVKIETQTAAGLFHGGGSIIVGADAADNVSELTPCFRIDDFPIENLTLLQLDVEGYEKNALVGAKDTILKFEPIILIEDNSQNCAGFLTDMGYELCFMADGLFYWAKKKDVSFVCSLEPR